MQCYCNKTTDQLLGVACPLMTSLTQCIFCLAMKHMLIDSDIKHLAMHYWLIINVIDLCAFEFSAHVVQSKTIICFMKHGCPLGQFFTKSNSGKMSKSYFLALSTPMGM